MDFRNKERDIILCILFSIFTLGIYTVYWVYIMTEEANALSDNEYGCAEGKLVIIYSLITLGLYLCYWAFKMGDRLYLAKAKRGVFYGRNNGIIYALLSLIELDVLNFIFMQYELNKIAVLDIKKQIIIT